MDTKEKKKYNYMENVLQVINRNYISLPDDEVARNNKILKEILTVLTNKMKETDVLFKSLFSTIYYGGSYYDGLRVGNPEEYDLDLLLNLPKCTQPTLSVGNIPGFVHLQLKEFEKFQKLPEAAAKYKNLKTLLDDGSYLITNKVLDWMQSVLTKTLNEFTKRGTETVIPTGLGVFNVKYRKGGPALTLNVSGTIHGQFLKMDIDMVPCFLLDGSLWPVGGYRANPVKEKSQFFIVPKIPNSDNKCIVGRYWRLSFQEQERTLINGYKNLKPSLKLLKKLRDNRDHKLIASYYIKTIFLWEVENQDKSFWNNSLSFVFMHMLKKYIEYLDSEKIPYFWNKKNNLISKIDRRTMENMKNNYKHILADVEKNSSEPLTVAKYLVKAEDLNKLRGEVGNKQLNQAVYSLALN